MTALYKLETFLLLRRNSCLEEDRVRPVLSVEERHVAVHLAEQVHTLVSLLVRTINNKFINKLSVTNLEMRIIFRQRAGTARTPEGPPRRHFHGRFPGDVSDQEVHGKDCGYHAPEPLLDPVVVQFRPYSPDQVRTTATPLARFLVPALQYLDDCH